MSFSDCSAVNGSIVVDYYGYRDDDDGLLIPLEEKAEKLAIAEAVKAWKEKQQQRANGEETGAPEEEEDEEDNIYPVDEEVRIQDLIGFKDFLMKMFFISVRKREIEPRRGEPWIVSTQIHCTRSSSLATGHRGGDFEEEETGVVGEIRNRGISLIKWTVI